MKNAIITVIIIFIVISVMSNSRYFPRMTEITLAEPVFVIGIDACRGELRSPDSSARVTIVYEKIESSDEGGNAPNQKFTDSVSASSPAAALETLKKRFPREMAVSTAEYFLIGEEAARENLERYIDFLAKNNTLRLTSSVFIVRGAAEEASEILTETRTLDILRNYGEYSGINAISSSMEFFELLSKLAETGRAFAVPALAIKVQNDEQIVVPSGYAIIKDGVLTGFLDSDTARGYNLLTNKSVFSTIELPDNSATRLENSSRKITFEWDENELTGIRIDVKFTASVIDGDGDLRLLEREQNRVIFEEIQEIISTSKLYGCDFLNFGEALRMRHPLRLERLKNNWNEIYSQVPVKINVESELS